MSSNGVEFALSTSQLSNVTKLLHFQSNFEWFEINSYLGLFSNGSLSMCFTNGFFSYVIVDGTATLEVPLVGAPVQKNQPPAAWRCCHYTAYGSSQPAITHLLFSSYIV